MAGEPNPGAGALPSLDTPIASKDGEVLGVPQAPSKRKSNVGRLAVLGMGLLGGLFVLAGILLWSKHRVAKAAQPPQPAAARLDPTKVKNQAVESANIEAQKAEIKKKEQEARGAEALAAAKAQAAQASASAGAVPTANAGGTAPNPTVARTATASGQSASAPPTRQQQRLAGDVLVGMSASNGSAVAQANGDPPPAPSATALLSAATTSAPAVAPNGAYGPPSVAPSSPRPDALEARLQPSVLEARSAGRLGNLDYLLKKGTTIPCALKTGIDTTLPGFVICSVINDVYSANGKTLLIERGASVFGEQKSSVAQGQARVFVLWTRIDNPSGVFASLDSPATDQQGYPGVPGHVDTHFWERFGGAILLSVIQDSLAAVVAKESNTGSSGGVQVNNTTSTAQQMATEALKNSINIPPTIRVLPGRVVNVMTARDVSFESVYQLVH
jgi:type IV secretion system protein VirB10